jgi:hypothetical protein
MLHNMVAKKIPAKKVPTKKAVTKSSVETNRSKTPQAKAAARTDSKGRTGMGATSSKKQIPASFGKREEGLRRLQLATMLGAKISNVGVKNITNNAAKDVYKGTMREAGRGIKTSVPGGRIHNTQTPEGPNIRSTKVMTPPQLSAAQKGLATRAGNISRSAADSAKPFASQAAKAGGRAKVISGVDKSRASRPKKKK